MAENAFNSGAISDRELQGLEETTPAPMGGAGSVSDEEFRASITLDDVARYLRKESGAAISDEEYRATVDAISAFSGELTGPSVTQPVNPGAFSGVAPGQQIGASPVNPGATRGAPMQESGINPYDQNSMMEYVQRKADEIKGRMGGGQPNYSGSFENFLRSTQPRQPQTGGGTTTDAEFKAYQDAIRPRMRPVGSGSTTDAEMQQLRMMRGKQ